MVRRCVTFLNIASPNSPLYLNPVLVQSLAGAVQEELSDGQVDVFDGAAGDSYSRSLEHLGTNDVAVICMMADAHLDEFLSAAIGSLKAGVPIVTIGALVTDGEAELVLSRVISTLPNNPTYAFVGRESDRFVSALKAVASHSSVHELPNVVSLMHTKAPADWNALPTITKAPQLLFTDTIVEAIDVRGIAVLMEGLTRGCEYHCTYCHLNFNKQTSGLVQQISGDSVWRIINVADRIPENSFIFFTDENFFGGRGSAGRDRLEAIVRLSEDLIGSGFCRDLAVDTRIDSLYHPNDDKERGQLRRRAWRSFKSAGLKYAYLGVESFSESQLRRYAKTAEYPAIIPGIALARELDLAFTLGMIIMDPLVTPLEVQETLAFVDRMDLYPYIASPLKPLRLGVNSPYAGWAAKRLHTANWSAFPSGVDTFRDARVREIWPIVHRIHSIFSESGYRHSDVALFDSVFGAGSSTVKRVPEMVARMECEVLRTLIDGGPTDEALRFTVRAVEDTVHLCRDWVANRVETPGSIQEKVRRYYRTVFDVIHTQVARQNWLEEAFR